MRSNRASSGPTVTVLALSLIHICEADLIVVDQVQRSHAAAGQCLHGIATHTADAKPVSYTHLDVYKRQVRLHAEDGVDFVTLHCGITRKTIDQIRTHKRKMNLSLIHI